MTFTQPSRFVARMGPQATWQRARGLSARARGAAGELSVLGGVDEERTIDASNMQYRALFSRRFGVPGEINPVAQETSDQSFERAYGLPDARTSRPLAAAGCM